MLLIRFTLIIKLNTDRNTWYDYILHAHDTIHKIVAVFFDGPVPVTVTDGTDNGAGETRPLYVVSQSLYVFSAE